MTGYRLSLRQANISSQGRTGSDHGLGIGPAHARGVFVSARMATPFDIASLDGISEPEQGADRIMNWASVDARA